MQWSGALKNLDQFRVVSKDLTRTTVTGGAFTALAYALLTLLLIAEMGAFLRTSYTTNVVMDTNMEALMQINFDVTLFDLPCKFLKLGVWDKFGEERIDTHSDQFHYIPIDHSGAFKGMAYTKEELSVLEQADISGDLTEEEKKEIDSDWSSSDDHWKHHDFKKAVTFHDYTLVNFYADWCSHCRDFYPTWLEAVKKIDDKMVFSDSDGRQAKVKMLRINCVDFAKHCNEAKIAAFPSMRLYKRDGNFESFEKKRSIENMEEFLRSSVGNSHLIVAQHHAMFNEGCQVQGTLRVPRVPGHFHLQAEAFSAVNINPALTNVSHIVNHLSFGEPEVRQWAERQKLPIDIAKHLSPLDGKRFIVERFHEAPQHYLKVVTTRFEGRDKVFYQMTHTDRVRKLRNKQSGKAPQARFSYDFSPMSVVIKAKTKRWYEFLTSMFAILGGTYTIVELLSGTVDSVHTAVKDAIGKSN